MSSTEAPEPITVDSEVAISEQAAPEEEAPVAETSGSPADFLKHVVGESVVVRLNSGVDYRG